MNSNAHAADDSNDALRSAVDKYRRLVSETVSDLLPGVTAEVGIDHREDHQEPVIVVTVPVGKMDLQLMIEPSVFGTRPDAEINELLRARISEALAHQERFAARLADVRTRVEASVERAGGGLRLSSLAMDVSPIDCRFHWHEARLEARIDMLDEMLQSKIVRLHGYIARRFAGTLRWLGRDQRRRAARRDRLAGNNAILEVDAIAEAMIAAHELTVGEVASRLLAGTRHIYLSGDVSKEAGDSRVGVSIEEGRLIAFGYVAAANPPAFLHGTRVRIDASLPDAERARLVGRSPAEVIDHPAMIDAARITSANERDQRVTDLTLRVKRRFITADELRAA